MVYKSLNLGEKACQTTKFIIKTIKNLYYNIYLHIYIYIYIYIMIKKSN
ncbi:rCG20096 [Rattus norvegicus]|uniref:RCG20096 n=1 Tax=Rattus norvegicus TaxID=10116 RepID=A6JH51_RAT|nr:rCG20096 [Rattus norvegicus]